ncbi:hypothetical protein N7520_010203 [Penicillium odoratum]|uniref:uncharacterized protein n=1 Tax=Penicillium odoratum TaxID=1167516 RepID=UPI0025480D4D|nr:uncharacterized protein N7520_010203 [Penicillium odoratum]KAJ5753286.1 hypothetical protein N7520_010203 [Penicillium odoratum]
MMLYRTGGQGSMRYFFVHGNHEHTAIPNLVIVEANIVVFNRLGRIVFGNNKQNYSSLYCFINGVCTQVNGKDDTVIPARELTERLLRNASIPTLIIAEIPACQGGIFQSLQDEYLYLAVLVYGRDDLKPCDYDDRNYLATALRGFIPYFVESISLKSDNYLPGDAQTLCREIASYLATKEDVMKAFTEFIQMYRKRYLSNAPVQRAAVLETCLLHILKMPFDLESSIRHGLLMP